MDWGTIGTAIGGAVAAGVAVPLIRSKFERGGEEVRMETFRSTMVEVVNGKLGQTMQTQTRLLEKVANAQEQMASSLAVLTALEQQRRQQRR